MSLTQEVSNLVSKATELTDKYDGELGKWQTERTRLVKALHDAFKSLPDTQEMTIFIDQSAADGGNGTQESPVNSLGKALDLHINVPFIKRVLLVLLSSYTLEQDEYIGERKGIKTPNTPSVEIDLNRYTLTFGERFEPADTTHQKGYTTAALVNHAPVLYIRNGVVRFPDRHRVTENADGSSWFMQNKSTSFKFSAERFYSQRINFYFCRVEVYRAGSDSKELAVLPPVDETTRQLLVGSSSGKHTYSGTSETCKTEFRDCLFASLDPDTNLVSSQWIYSSVAATLLKSNLTAYSYNHTHLLDRLEALGNG